MNSYLLFFMFNMLVMGGRADPISSCDLQSGCLSLNMGTCVNNNRTVCLEWVPNENCVKASETPTDESVSHACAGLGGDKDLDGDGLEEWHNGVPICQTVTGGNDVVFGVKDGRGCSNQGVFSVNGYDDSAQCSGPLNVCDGNNDKECAWTFSTPVCEDDDSEKNVSEPEEVCVEKRVYTVVKECTRPSSSNVECTD